jgi:hypothetical protein
MLLDGHEALQIFQGRYPQLTAASLKHEWQSHRGFQCPRYPQLNAAASLKHQWAALASLRDAGYPRLNAAASLKLERLVLGRRFI